MERFTNHELKVIADCLSDRINYALYNYNPQACLEVTQQLCPILDKICEAYGSADADSSNEPSFEFGYTKCQHCGHNFSNSFEICPSCLVSSYAHFE